MSTNFFQVDLQLSNVIVRRKSHIHQNVTITTSFHGFKRVNESEFNAEKASDSSTDCIFNLIKTVSSYASLQLRSWCLNLKIILKMLQGVLHECVPKMLKSVADNIKETGLKYTELFALWTKTWWGRCLSLVKKTSVAKMQSRGSLSPNTTQNLRIPETRFSWYRWSKTSWKKSRSRSSIVFSLWESTTCWCRSSKQLRLSSSESCIGGLWTWGFVTMDCGRQGNARQDKTRTLAETLE